MAIDVLKVEIQTPFGCERVKELHMKIPESEK